MSRTSRRAGERERRQELLAELAVGDPRRALLERLERRRVDMDRPSVAELDVVGRRILECPAGRHRLQLDIERQQRRLAQLAERPLVWITQELDRLRLDDGVCAGHRREVDIGALVPDQPPLLEEATLERASLECIPLGRERSLDLAIRLAVAPEDERARIAERRPVAPVGTDDDLPR